MVVKSLQLKNMFQNASVSRSSTDVSILELFSLDRSIDTIDSKSLRIFYLHLQKKKKRST